MDVVNIKENWRTLTSLKPRSEIIISANLSIFTEKKYRKFQKRMWKWLLNIEIKDVGSDIDEM